MSTLRVLRSTQERWLSKLADETTEQHPLAAMIKSKGRVTFGASGTVNAWTVRFKEIPLLARADMEQVQYVINQTLQKPELPWRGYVMPEAITRREMLQNRGREAVVKLFTDRLKIMREDAFKQFNAEFYRDGNLAGNENRMHGIESFMKITPGSQTAGDTFATVLADSYGGLSTLRGALGGSTRSDPEFDFWSPIIVSTNRTGTTWAADADEHLRNGIIFSKYGVARADEIDVITMSRANYVTLIQLLEGKERLVFSRGEDQGVAKFGFKALNFDGVDITVDPDVPTPDVDSDVVRAYGWKTSRMELLVMDKSMWGGSGSVFSEEDFTFRFWLAQESQLQFDSPRHFVKWADIA